VASKPPLIAKGKRPVAASEFPAALAALCNTLNIKIEATDTGVYLLRVKIMAAAASAGAGPPDGPAPQKVADFRRG